MPRLAGNAPLLCCRLAPFGSVVFEVDNLRQRQPLAVRIARFLRKAGRKHRDDLTQPAALRFCFHGGYLSAIY
jgi:hypothetical protein